MDGTTITHIFNIDLKQCIPNVQSLLCNIKSVTLTHDYCHILNLNTKSKREQYENNTTPFPRKILQK